ncbi:MAG: hypothetical protein JXR19_01780 [Bacteroidia bacterium]
MQKFLAMAVTRLERKGRKNKTVAKVRVATIKRLKSKITVESEFKSESGIIVGDVADVIKEMEANKKAPKKEAAKEAPAKETKAKAKTEEAPKEEKATKAKEAPKAKKAPAKKTTKKPAAKKTEKAAE